MKKDFQTLISVAEVLERYNADDVTVFDCRFWLNDIFRGRREYLHAHIPGAVYLDTNNDLSSPVIRGVTGRHPLPHPEILTATLRSSGLENDHQVIVYDQSNSAYASRAWWLLRWLGHNKVAVMNGGFDAWIAAGGPVENQWPLPRAGHFNGRPRMDWVVEKEKIESLESGLIDSREYKRYTGEYEPIDPVAGHIPGAVCTPYPENTDESGLWKKPDELRARFKEITSDDTPVFYCGSGITACHNILAYKIATGRDARLYAGGWSEWIVSGQ